MTAKEMFEELGYKIKYHIENSKLLFIGYTFDKNTDVLECEIMFNVRAKVFLSNMWIDNKLYKAINKQIEELGWNK